jgi:hypothetical protein
MPSFDLNGLPRIDLTIAEDVDDIAKLLKKIDPALAPTQPTPDGRAPLVVHRLRRRDARFDRGDGVMFADPAEVLLDLPELRLVDQADELVRSLRARAA